MNISSVVLTSVNYTRETRKFFDLIKSHEININSTCQVLSSFCLPSMSLKLSEFKLITHSTKSSSKDTIRVLRISCAIIINECLHICLILFCLQHQFQSHREIRDSYILKYFAVRYIPMNIWPLMKSHEFIWITQCNIRQYLTPIVLSSFAEYHVLHPEMESVFGYFWFQESTSLIFKSKAPSNLFLLSFFTLVLWKCVCELPACNELKLMIHFLPYIC